MIRDRNMDWLRQVHRIPYQLFGFEPSHTHAIAEAGTSTVTGSAEGLVGMDDGAPEIREVSTFGFGGIFIGATGDSMTTLDLYLPPKIDVEKEIGVRTIWTTNGAVDATDAVTWTTVYDQVDIGEAVAAPATALDTAVALANPTATTLLLRRSPRGIINANKFDFTARQGAIAWNVMATTTGFAANEVVFLALEIDYIPLVCANRDEDIDVFSSLAVSD